MIAACLVLALASQTTAPQEAPLQPATWKINQNHSMVWDQAPWLPVGVRIPGTVDQVELCIANGITNAIVELPADGNGWGPVIKLLRESNIRYMISINSGAPTTEVVAIEPEGYRLANIQGPIDQKFKLPGATSALVVLAANRDRSVRWEKRMPVTDGVLHVKDSAGPGSMHTLLIYPLVKDMRTADHWESFDRYRDQLLGALKAQELGPNFRGIINPLGNISRFTPTKPEYIPTSPMFQIELESFLTQKYGALQTAMRSWSMRANDIRSFRELSQLVPLWSGDRGVDELWNPSNDRTYRTDMKSSSIWRDISEVVQSSANRRYNRLVGAIKQLVNCPILQDWNGWNGPYERDETDLDGVGFRTTDRGIIQAVDDASRPMSTVSRQRKSMVAFATSIRLQRGQSRITAQTAVQELEGIGARGWFFEVKTPEDWTEISALIKAAPIDSDSASWKPEVLYYPESARDPAVPARILGGLWWLPSPGGGDRLDFGDDLQGYRYFDGIRNYMVLWATQVPVRAKFRVQDPKDIIFENLDGSPVEIKSKKTEIEFVVPTTPILLKAPREIPIPVASYERTVALIDTLIEKFPNRVDTLGSERFAFKDAIQSYERNPGGGFTTLQQILERIMPKAAPYSWMEGESTLETNFGRLSQIDGVSGRRVLTIQTKLAPPPGGYYAKFRAIAPSQGSQEVWIAGRIPESMRGSVRVKAGTQEVQIVQDPVSFYGPGFGWYKLGSLILTAGQNELIVYCGSDEGAEMDIDVVMASPVSFNPSGPRMPTDWLIEFLKAQPATPKKD